MTGLGMTGLGMTPRDAPVDAATTRTRVGHLAVQSGALALVTVATALAFGRVFRDRGFVPMLVTAAIIPHAIGFLGRVRGWSTRRTTALAALTTALVLTWIVAGETTAYGLPLPGTARRIAELLGHGWQVFRTGVAPVPSRAGVVLLCALAMAVGAVVADAIAARPGVTLGALAPTLVLFVLTGTLGTHDLRIPATAAYVAAALVDLVIANAARVETRRTWFTGRRLASDAAVIRSAALVGGAAILTGLVLTPFIPGIESGALLRYRGGSGHGGGAGLSDYTTVSPLVDLRARLNERANNELFRVSSPKALYWRLVALDRFDGTVWSVASDARDAAAVFRSRSVRGAVLQKFTIGALGDQWVPAAFTAVNTTMGNTRLIPGSSTLIAPNSISGTNYEVQSQVERPPTPAAIAATSGAVPTSVRPFLTLPAGFPASLRAEAARITAAAATPYAKAAALETFFARGAFAYDVHSPLTNDTEAISAFLRLKRGFCQQFAGAFAALARAVGLPARVAVGFTPGDRDPTSGDYIVRGRDAHAWVEVWLAGLGWRTFEPTPAGPDPGQAVATADGPSNPDAGAGPVVTPTTVVTRAAAASGSAGGGRRIPKSETLVSTQPTVRPDTWDTRRIALIVVPTLILAAAMTIVIARLIGRMKRRRRRRGAAEPAHRIAGAWSEALDTCTEAGLPVSAALTPREQASALRDHGAPLDAVLPLRELADIYAEIEFSPHAPSIDASDRAWTATDEVRAAFVEGISAKERARRMVHANRSE